MFVIDAIKLNIEKKLKTHFIFYKTVKGRRVGSVQNKISFVSLRVKFAGGNINNIQKKRERSIILFLVNLRESLSPSPHLAPIISCFFALSGQS